MKIKPLLSIVIPSRNRQKYALPCIQSVLSISNNNMEVIVHDNSDTNELEELIAQNISDSRLVYHYDSTPMSTIHNFDIAMNYVNGEYVCFIGDDDGINPEIINATFWAAMNNLDAIIERKRIGYRWPDNNCNGILSIPPFTSKISYVNVMDELESFLKEGNVNYMEHDLPRVYHGLVKKECFDFVKQEIGCYFGGLSADIFSSVAISLVASKVVVVDYPLTIAGNSPASDITHRTEEARNLELKDAPHFRARGKYFWAKQIPKVYSGATIWAESSIQALKAFNRIDLIEKVNKTKLLVHIVNTSPNHINIITQKYLEDYAIGLTKYKITKLFVWLNMIYEKVINKLVRTIKGQKLIKINGVENINQAMEETQRILIDKPFKNTSF